MPYVIETRTPIAMVEPLPAPVVAAGSVRRHAVATLEEARDFTFNARVNEDGQIESLPESGGTVGSLPDGTVIEVVRLSTMDIAAAALVANDYHFGELTDAEVIDAYNAREARHA